ncbi:MAG: SH3 domain-containing protein [Deltaproteobacteria bacterium]|nr:SH3 domain-containing protein [Deltaproteobacteria bacterium]
MWRSLSAAILVVVTSAGADGARKERPVLVVVESDAVMRLKPDSNAASVKTLALGTEVKKKGQRGRWMRVDADGSEGWLPREHVAPRTSAGASLYDRGMKLLHGDANIKAMAYLEAATRAAPTDRRVFVALLAAYDSAGKKAEAEGVKERLKAIDRWLHGTWCDGAQRAFIIFWPSGDYYFRLERSSNIANRGRYTLRDGEILLVDADNIARNTTIRFVDREVGRTLIDRSQNEYLRVLCRGDEKPE